MNDQAALATRCTTNSDKAGQADQPAASQTSQPETAIVQNKIDQTTGNAQLGGVHVGLSRPLYHSPGRNTAPEEAVAKLRPKKVSSAKIEDNSKATSFSSYPRGGGCWDARNALA